MVTREMSDIEFMQTLRGFNKPEFQSLELERTANELYYPSYLSFESALSRYGILSQIPYTNDICHQQTLKKNFTSE